MNQAVLEKLGFYFGASGAHAGRALMLDDLAVLLEHAPADAQNAWFSHAILEDNLLAKATVNNRDHANRRMRQLYGLDSRICLYRNFRRLYFSEKASLPMLAVLIAMARDALFRKSAEVIRECAVGSPVDAPVFAKSLDAVAGGRMGKETLRHACGNVLNSWGQAGYLSDGKPRQRQRPEVGAAACAYALFLGWLQGVRGRLLFETEWAKTLDRSADDLIALATAAARRGMLEMLHAGGVIEVRFPGYLTDHELSLL
jgi:hypothetical protein